MNTDPTQTTRWRAGLQMRLGDVWMRKLARTGRQWRNALQQRAWRVAYSRGRI